jgi:hypothetical protein
MSVTFSPAYDPADVTAWQAECHADYSKPTIVVTAATRDAARVEAAAHNALCRDCDAYGVLVEAVTECPEVNMANGNARYVMGLLGIEFGDGSGSMPAAEFAERLGFATVVGGGDAGTVTVEYREAGGARVIECGRPVGYADQRLAQLVEIAEWALAHGREVHWG